MNIIKKTCRYRVDNSIIEGMRRMMTTTTELQGSLVKRSFDNELLVRTCNNDTITPENEAAYGLMALVVGASWSILEQYMSNDYDPFSNAYLHTETSSATDNAIWGNAQFDLGFVYNNNPGDLNTDPNIFVVSNFAIPAAADAVNLHAADITLS